MLDVSSNRSLALIAVVSIALASLAISLGCRDLWAPDEPRYAQIAKEMWESGEYFLPQLNGERYSSKPPGYFWLIILASLPSGEVNEVTARLPSVFLGIATLVALFLWVNKYQPDRPPMAVPLVLLTSQLFWWFGSRANIDVSFAFFIALACICFHHGYCRSGGRFSTYYVVAYLAVGTALIVKGPFGLLPVPVMITFLLVTGDRRGLSGLKLGLGFLLLL